MKLSCSDILLTSRRYQVIPAKFKQMLSFTVNYQVAIIGHVEASDYAVVALSQVNPVVFIQWGRIMTRKRYKIMTLIKKLIPVGAVALSIFSTLSAADNLVVSLSNDDGGIFQRSQDMLYGKKSGAQDDYTQGLFLGYALDISRDNQLAFYIGQDLFSPTGENKRKATAIPGDRAFSGYLFTGVDWNSISNPWVRHRLALDVGVVGKDAGGKRMQNAMHQVIKGDKYPAWDDQIKNRYGAVLKSQVTLTPNIDMAGINVGLYPELSAVGGNLFQYYGWGATLALGNDKQFNADNGYGLLNRRGLMHLEERGLVYKLFAGANQRWVGMNYTLEGRTQQTNQQTVDRKHLVNEYQVGAALGYTPVMMSLSLHKVTSEYKGGDDHSYVLAGVGLTF